MVSLSASLGTRGAFVSADDNDASTAPTSEILAAPLVGVSAGRDGRADRPASLPEPDEVRDLVMAAIVRNGGHCASRSLAERVQQASKAQLKWIVKSLSKAGRIVVSGYGPSATLWLPANAPARSQATPPVPSAAAVASSAKTAAADPREAVLAALQKNRDAAQDALDSYLVSVADPRVTEPLKVARDNAQAALNAWVGIGVTT